MTRPTEYFVEYDLTPDEWSPLDLRRENADTATEARRLARAIADHEHVCVTIYRRFGIEDVTPPEDPPGLIYDWSEELIGETL